MEVVFKVYASSHGHVKEKHNTESY